MLNIVALIHKGARLLPRKEAVHEASGYAVLGLGIFLALATFSYNPHDILAVKRGLDSVQNIAGPVGAWMSFTLLKYFGVVGVLWPVVMTIWGSLMVLGFVVAPEARRILGLIAFTIILSALSRVQLPGFDLREPSFGFGGLIGENLGGWSLRKLGYGGATIFLAVVGFASLVLTGNLAIARTRSNLNFLWHRSLSMAKSLYASYTSKVLSDEELIKLALREEVRNSRSLAKKTSRPAAASEAARAAFDLATPTTGEPLKPAKGKAKLKQASSGIDLDALADAAIEEVSSEGAEPVIIPGSGVDFYYEGKSHGKPDAGMFSRSTKAKERGAEFKKMGEKLTHQLAQFKVDGKITKIVEGPVVTTFEFEPVPGTKVSKITALAQDLARLLQANSLRILAPIPGKRVVGFEVPNAERRTIGFADLVAHRDLKSSKIALPVAMGVDAFGHVIIEDLAKMPHLLVAGSTGSGKSVFMNTLIGGLIARHSARDLRFVMIDPKMVELAAYNNLPHMACPVITDPAGEAKEKLDALVAEMEDRFNKMRIVGARNLQGFNDMVKKAKKTDFPEFTGKWQPMPFIVLIIDELADMMMQLGKDAEIPITRLAQKARAAGIHLVIATQRPSADVVTGLIKANFPTRIAFRVLSGLDSRTILDTSGAEGLIGQGDMLFLNAMGLRRMHGAYLSDSEVHNMVKACKPK